MIGLIGVGIKKDIKENKKPWFVQNFNRKKQKFLEYVEESTETGISQLFIVSMNNKFL